MLKTRLFFTCISLFITLIGSAQTRYNISNRTVNECEGILVDSELGKDPGVPNGYGHNENYCFTICVPNSPQITINFSFFSLEVDCAACDYVTIYDGPNSGSPLIGQWGARNNPGSVTSTGGCITVCFHSDNIVSGEGFELSWNATPPPPIPPVIQAIPDVNCKSNSVTINFDKPVPCGQLVPGNFTFAGPAGGSVTSVTPVNCVNGFASSAILGFGGQLDQSGNYNITFDFNYTDICFKTYRFQIAQSFRIINCPLMVTIVGNNSVCDGSCTNLTAVVTGGNPANYQFAWTPNVGNTAVVSVCPTVDQTYTVTVTDGASQPASASHLVTVRPLPDAGDTISMCRFGPDVNFAGTPPGGVWGGPGIVNANNGTFRPSAAGPGVHNVVYQGPNGCQDIKKVTVHQVSAGNKRAVCLNSAPFQLNGTPVGGTWNGTNVSATGLYNPITLGIFTMTYTEPINGCTATQIVEIVDSIIVPDTGTIATCDKQGPFQIPFTPTGGTWSGTGITTAWNGTFNPAVAGIGRHTVYYTINGCMDSTDVTVSAIDAGPDVLICPRNPSQLMPNGSPAFGTWSGPGIIDNGDSTYTFDPSLVTINTTLIHTYTKDGCSDARQAFFYLTVVTDDTLKFCSYDNTTFLDPAFTKPNLNNGVWSGLGLVGNDSINPKALPVGITYLKYEYLSNGCIDSMAVLIKVKPNAGFDIDTCPKAGNFILNGLPKPGLWTGAGIANTNTGEFSPSAAGFGSDGVFPVYYNVQGCLDTAVVTLKTVDPTFIGLRPYFCLNNTTVNLTAFPPGGTFSGPGITGNTFNPNNAGTGTHQIIYTYGNADCTVRDTQFVQVLSPISFDFNYDNTKLCYGDSVLINIAVSGGDSTLKFHYIWNPDKGDRNFNYIKPTGLTTFSLTVTDGCSADLTKSAQIDVWPQITYNLTTGPSVCFGEVNWGKIEVTTPPKSDFDVHWLTSPEIISDSVTLVAAKYKILITNRISNCELKTTALLPYYDFINAAWIKTPLEECVLVTNPKFEFINLSTGATQGYWSFGDGFVIPYDPNLNPIHIYSDTGKYHVKLFIANDAGCKDSIETDVCVEPVQQYLMPNAFTPNGDGNNDVFPTGQWIDGKYILIGYGITDYDLFIFDRWGKLLYETDNRKLPWNGRLNNTGELQKNGVYVYRMNVYFGPRDIKELTGHVTLIR